MDGSVSTDAFWGADVYCAVESGGACGGVGDGCGGGAVGSGLAFGSGRIQQRDCVCVGWIGLGGDGVLGGGEVLDFGCGSGILALAALKLGAVYAVGVDNDPQALLASRENALRNGVAERLGVYLPAEAPVRRYPVVVANILASTLVALAERLAGYVAPGGRLALSGILRGGGGGVALLCGVVGCVGL